jgi:hypothetical protein
MVGNGDVFVGFSMAVGNVAMFFNAFDPVRYAPLAIPDDGLRLDIMAQVAWLMRSPAGLLASLGFSVQDVRVYSFGASLCGAMQLTFINNGYHARSRTPSGRPVIDGYLSAGIWYPLYDTPQDAPVIRLNSENEVQGLSGPQSTSVAARRCDGNTPDNRFRIYEIPGMSHMDSIDQAQFTVSFYQIGLRDFVTVHPLNSISDLPCKRIFYTAALAMLDKWVRDGIAPPSADDRWIELNPDGSIARDGDNNALGGVRPYWMDLPISTVSVGCESPPGAPPWDPSPQLLHEEPFTPAELTARYGDRATYLAQVGTFLDTQIAEGFTLQTDRQMLLDHAAAGWDAIMAP